MALYRSRMWAALLFGVTVLPGWTVWWLFTPYGKDDSHLLLWSFVAGGLYLTGFLSAPRLQKDATQKTQLWRGAVAGVFIIILTLTILSGLAILVAVALSALHAESIREFARELTSFNYLAFALLASGGMLFILLSPFGAMSGVLYYWLETMKFENETI